VLPLLTIGYHTSIRLAEIGYLLILIAGVWIVFAELVDLRWRRFRMVVAGGALIAAGLLLFIATHYGTFGLLA
jgi:hypothetical protein